MPLVNSASEYVEASRDRSPVHRYVADNGVGVAGEDIEHVMVAGRRVALSVDLTAEERTLVEKAMKATRASAKTCFANALRMWVYDNRFAYAEGFAAMTDPEVTTPHAWCMLDGAKLVDVTEPFEDYHGAIISDPVVFERYTGADLTNNGIIGNHTNRYEFLRERGYTDYG
jgi:hypothetical protein